MPMTEHKISFCIVCMNRLHQLKRTLLQNIADNQQYTSLEYILLDYNSQDGLEEWAKENLGEFIANNRLVYYKTFEPAVFNHSHSKNVAFSLATGEIVCNINADHYTGAEFASYVNQQFTTDNNIVLTPVDFYKTKKDHRVPKDVYGKVVVKKNDFLAIKGFDEQMKGYGFEDWDFINRLELINVKRVLIEDCNFLQFISHGQDERFTLPTDHFKRLYVHHCTPSISEIIYIYKDNYYERGVLIDNSTQEADKYVHAYKPRTYLFEYGVKNLAWESGQWKELPEGDCIQFSSRYGPGFILQRVFYDQEALMCKRTKAIFYPITSRSIVNNLLQFNYDLHNRLILENNLKYKKYITNLCDFGKVTVFKNFQYDIPIVL